MSIDGDFALILGDCVFVHGDQFLDLKYGLCLSFTQGVQIVLVESGDTLVAVVGTIYDCLHPALGCHEVVARLAEVVDSDYFFVDYLSKLGGAFVVLVIKATSVLAYTDATALRKVYYRSDCRVGSGVVVSSRLDWLVQENDELVVELVADSSSYSKIGTAPYLPVELTPFKSVKCLNPSHRLDCLVGRSLRFFPYLLREQLTPDKTFESFVSILRGSAQALLLQASSSLRIAMTAGFDSRTTYTCCV